MSVAHVTTAATLRAELAEEEARAEALQRELVQSQQEVVQARRAGAALLRAVEAAMAPLMFELAAAKRDGGAVGSGGLAKAAAATGGEDVSTAALEEEIRHLRLDIGHYQDQVEHLQVEERTRSHEQARLHALVAEASENLHYEQQCMRHHEVCKVLSLSKTHPSMTALGGSVIGRRTMEVRSEQKLRALAEQRNCQLSRDVTKLASDTAAQQLTIEALARRLQRVRQSLHQKERQLAGATTHFTELESKLRLSDPADSAGGTPGSTGAGAEAGGGEGGPGAGSRIAAFSTGPGKGMRVRKGKGTSSTGKLPQLSF